MVNNVLKIIAEFEGFRSKPYLDSAGVPTIGFGSTFYADGTRVTMQDAPISFKDAQELKRTVIIDIWNRIKPLIKVELSENQKAALISFTYNVGVGAFSSSTLLKVINAGGSPAEIEKQFLRWVYAGGQKLNGLIKRRKAEAFLYNKKKVNSVNCL